MSGSVLGTMEPDDTLAVGFWVPTGAPSIHEAIQLTGAYAGDGSYIQMPIQVGTTKVSLSAPPTIPPYTRITHIRIYVRAKVDIDPANPLRIDLRTSRGSVPVEFTGFQGGFGLVFIGRSAIIASPPGGGTWTVEQLEELELNITAKLVTAPPMSVSRVYIEVWGNESPYTSTFTPTTVTDTSTPILEWAYGDTEGDPQEEVEIKMFVGAAFVADPTNEVARLLYDTGRIFYSGNRVRSGILRNGSYRWAVRARDVGSGAYDWGAWGQGAFTVSNPAPDPPSFTAVPDPANARYVLTIDSGGGPYAPEFMSVERSDDFGLTWVPVRTATRLPWTGTAVLAYDYEAPRMARPSTTALMVSVGYNEAVSYTEPIGYTETLGEEATGPQNPVRYRASAMRLLSGEELWGTLTAVSPDSLLGIGDTRLKHPLHPERSMVIALLADWESTSEEDLAALRGSGRADWVIFGDVASLEKGDIEIIFPGDDAWRAFELMRTPPPPESPVPLLLQTCFGDTVLEQHWVRLGSTRSVVRVTHTGQNNLQYRRVKVGFFETVAPLVDA